MALDLIVSNVPILRDPDLRRSLIREEAGEAVEALAQQNLTALGGELAAVLWR